MRYVVLDTNCLLQSISRRSAYYKVWEDFILGKYILCVSNEIIEEYEEIIASHMSSVAAQIGVAPIIAYHFGHFSTYFLFTNFLVIPLATIILYGTLLVLILPMLAPALLWVVALLNKALEWLSQVPYASIDGLHPSTVQIGLFYIAMLCIYAIVRRLAPNT